MTKIVTFTIAFLLLFLTAGIACDGGCDDNELIRVYACNWTEREMAVVIAPFDINQKWHTFILPKQSCIGKPEKYTGTVVPNCREMYLLPGLYKIYFRYDGEENYKVRTIKLCHKMPQPVELDFEE